MHRETTSGGASASFPQQAFLFSGTVASNLRYGDETADDEALWHALDIAQANEFVTEMEGELEAPIDQGGTNVSGGQRQRLAIARALVKRAPVYIFDDSFSALDFRTDARLRAALTHELSGATVLIVAQRVGTIMNADQIVVLDEGRVVGVGTHAGAARDLRDLPRDRLLAAHRGGGTGGMSGQGTACGGGSAGRAPSGRRRRRGPARRRRPDRWQGGMMRHAGREAQGLPRRPSAGCSAGCGPRAHASSSS